MVICAAGLSPARSAALQALRLPPPHPSPSCAAGSLASVRDPRTARTPRARRPLGLSGTGQRCCSRSHGVLTRRAHTARSYTAYAQLNASRRRRAHTFSSLGAQARSDEIMALPSVPQQEGRWATARASTARSEVNYFPSVSARQAGPSSTWALGVPSSPRTRSAAHSQHRACAHEVHPPKLPAPMHNLRRASLHFLEAGARTRDGRCREVDDAGSTMPAPASPPVCESLATAQCTLLGLYAV